MSIVLFSVIVVAIILIIVTLFDWLFDGIFGILELIRDWRNGEDQESAIIDPLPKGQKGTLTYQPYSDEEKLKMMKYLRRHGWGDWMHWNNWIKVEWVEQKKPYDRMGDSLLRCYKKQLAIEKSKENKH